MDRLDLKFLWYNSRARVYLLWAAIVAAGYMTTHYYQNKNINIFWFLLSLGGFFYMYKVMPLGVAQMKRIYLAWLVPISVGTLASGLSARGIAFTEMLPYLGSFWLIVTAVGFFWNGLVDRPMFWYNVAAVLCLIGAVLCYFNTTFLIAQYLVAGIISTWAMLWLFVFRTD